MDPTPFLGPWILQGGATGLVAWGVWMVFTGRLVPRRVLEDAMASERQRADDWRAAVQAERQRADLLDAQLRDILASAFPLRAREGI